MLAALRLLTITHTHSRDGNIRAGLGIFGVSGCSLGSAVSLGESFTLLFFVLGVIYTVIFCTEPTLLCPCTSTPITFTASSVQDLLSFSSKASSVLWASAKAEPGGTEELQQQPQCCFLPDFCWVSFRDILSSLWWRGGWMRAWFRWWWQKKNTTMKSQQGSSPPLLLALYLHLSGASWNCSPSAINLSTAGVEPEQQPQLAGEGEGWSSSEGMNWCWHLA